MYLVKTSPSKKRRAVTHGPLKKAGGAGPSLLVTTSSNNQHPALQHQVSSEAKEDSEGDNCKNWKYENEVFFNAGNRLCLLIPAEIQSSSMC